ncbi:MAG: FkbM family methyltransferase [Pyrinomonadaceae bacterium]|nr:FkbM family methyltransferase [Pyrinomonadaceae bacterium]
MGNLGRLNLRRFLKRCVTDPSSAVRAVRIVARDYYGQLYWSVKPDAPLAYQLPTGGTLLLEQHHAFTGCFWPDVDHYEPEVRTFLQDALRPNDTFIDCGANVGYFSVLAGALVGKGGTVVSIEANPITFKLLERNLQTNGFGTPIHCALTSQTGEVELFMPQDWDVFSSLRVEGLATGNPDHSFRVKAQTLDDVVSKLKLARVDVVKIDIEGGELDVLRSAPKLLSDFRPLIITEYGSHTWAGFEVSHGDLKELAQQFKYSLRLFDPQTRKLIPISDDVWQNLYVNVVMIPEERSESSVRNLRSRPH